MAVVKASANQLIFFCLEDYGDDTDDDIDNDEDDGGDDGDSCGVCWL